MEVIFPPLLYLILLFSLLLCFPRGVFPLPVLALKERLNFREQDTGKDLYRQLNNGDSQRRFNGKAFLLPFLQRDALVAKLPYRDAGGSMVTMVTLATSLRLKISAGFIVISKSFSGQQMSESAPWTRYHGIPDSRA